MVFNTLKTYLRYLLMLHHSYSILYFGLFVTYYELLRKDLANHKWFTTAWVNWVVEANPPRSLVRTFCSSRTLLTAVFTLIASSLSPRCWSILAEASKMAVGFATLRPVKRKKHSVVSLFLSSFSGVEYLTVCAE